MKRRFLVAGYATRKDGATAFLNSVIDLEPDERMNALAIDQIEKLVAGQYGAETVTLISFQQLEAPEPRYAIHDRLTDAWMEANEYCTDNEIEGDGNAINLLVRDHALVKTERDHLKGLLAMSLNTLKGIQRTEDTHSIHRDAHHVSEAIQNILRHVSEMRVEVEAPGDE